MRQITIAVSDKQYARLLDLLSKFEQVRIIADEQQNNRKTNKYQFADLAGKLEWKGDALSEQKKLRDEW